MLTNFIHILLSLLNFNGFLRTRILNLALKDILNGLAKASKDTRKGAYSKGGHSFDILAEIDPSKVQEASKYAERLITLLSKKLLST